MGGSYSTAGGEDEVMMEWTSDEENAAKKIFAEQENKRDSLKVHLQHLLPKCHQAVLERVEAISEEIQKKTSNKTFEECMLMAICKLVVSASTVDGLTSFLYEVMLKKTRVPNVADLHSLLTSLFEVFNYHNLMSVTSTNPQSHQDIISNFIRLFPDPSAAFNSSGEIHDALQKSPFFQFCLQIVIRMIFLSKDQNVATANLLPELEANTSSPPSMMSLGEVTSLAWQLPSTRVRWRRVFGSREQGESFTKLSSSLLHQGPLLLLVKEDASEGRMFGGFASCSVAFSSQFQCDDNSFLFSLRPEVNVYNPTGYNDHYFYLNLNQQTIPNGLGMGGQHGYFGLYVSDEYGRGHSRAKPKNTTFGSPQLSQHENFKIAAMEVWAVGEAPKVEEDEEEDEFKLKSMEKETEAKAILEVMGKQRYSEGFRENDDEDDDKPT